MDGNAETKTHLGRDLGLLMGLALAYRLAFLLAMPRVLDTADAIHYIETAKHLAQGDFFGYDPKIPLLYPLLSALAHWAIPDFEWACRSVSFAASVLVVAPVYLLARDLHGRGPARLAGVTVAIWPWLADYGCRVSTEALASFWWFLGVWGLARALRKGGISLWLAPLPFFALHLTRPEGMFILLAAIPAALVLGGREGISFARRLAPYVLVSVVLLALNTVYVRQLTGAATANYRIGFILREFDVLRFGETAAKTFGDVFPIMLGPVLLLFLGVGFFHPRGEKRDLALELYVLVFAAAQWGISLFVLSPAPRYLMMPIMALSMWSACGMALVSRTTAHRRLGALPAAALVAGMLLQTVITVGSEHLGRPPREPREYKEAGLWMKEHLAPGLIFCRKPQVGYYADMPSTGPDFTESLEQALERARNAGAVYLVVDERYTAQEAPALRPLLDPANAPAALLLQQRFSSYPQCRVVIYKLAPGVP